MEWEVKTVSTFPPEGLYTKDAETIARVMATKKVSPKGIGSAIRMVQFFINRAGKHWPHREEKSWRIRKRFCKRRSDVIRICPGWMRLMVMLAGRYRRD